MQDFGSCYQALKNLNPLGATGNHLTNVSGWAAMMITLVVFFTVLKTMETEHQETGAKFDNSNDLFVFKRMIVLDSKNCAAEDVAGDLCSLGVPCARRSRSRLRKTCSKSISSLLLSIINKLWAVCSLRRENALVAAIVSEKRDNATHMSIQDACD